MELKLTRKTLTDKSTIGELWIGDKFVCYTLEDRIREVKVMHETAIPAGRYEVILSFSNRFKKIMPLLLNVPGFEGIRIHSGNTSADSSGCILLGKSYAKDFVSNSRDAYAAFMNKVSPFFLTDKVFITIQ